jgi:hypothetical protein
MSRDEKYICSRKAETALQMAANARGFERQLWARIALLWQSLYRDDGRVTDEPNGYRSSSLSPLK